MIDTLADVLRARPSGFALVELVLVVGLLALVATMALPNVAPMAQTRVDAAAAEIAQALRFAQQEAIRTGAARVASLDPVSSRVRVFQLDMSTGSPVEDVSKPVFYPLIRQQNYDLALLTLPATRSVRIHSALFTFAGGSTATQLAFDATGAPVNILGPNPTDAKPLSTGEVDVELGNAHRAIFVDALTGRVTLSS